MTSEEKPTLSLEQKRMRIGLACLALGIACLLWAWASWLYRTSAEAERTTQLMGTPTIQAAFSERSSWQDRRERTAPEMRQDNALLPPKPTNKPANKPAALANSENGSDDT